MDSRLEQARSAATGGDMSAALSLSREVFTQAVDASSQGAVINLLASLGLFVDAEKMVRDAMEGAAENAPFLIQLARISMLRGSRGEEIERWRDIAQRFPARVEGHLGLCRALRKAANFDEAEAAASAGVAQLGRDRRLIAEWAQCSTDRGNWAAAAERWTEVANRDALDAGSCASFAKALIQLGDLDRAGDVLAQGQGRHSENVDFAIASAELATAREEWREAATIWQKLVEKHPNVRRLADGLGMAAWRLNVNLGESTGPSDAPTEDTSGSALERPVDIGLVNDQEIQELLLNFESLGRDCEFGLVQRHFGAEPLSLLRWTTTPPETLVRGLDNKFEGLGSGDETRLDLHKAEIMVVDQVYKIRFHTFTQQNPSLDLERFKFKQARHLHFLRNMTLSQISEAEKIFVYKGDRSFTLQQALAIQQSLTRYCDRVILVCVLLADEMNEPGTSRRLNQNLFLGYLKNFGQDHGPAWQIDFSSWIKICRAIAAQASEQGSPV